MSTPAAGAPLFLVPANSMRRDPAAAHKRAYVRILAEAFGAELIRFQDERQMLRDLIALRPTVVLTFNLPWYDRYGDLLIQALPPEVRLVSIHDDCRRQMHRRLPVVLDRSDAVISPVREPVLRQGQFPAIADKLWRLPYCIPREMPRYQLAASPRLKCLLAGAAGRSYPLRQRVLNDVPRQFVTRLPHPGYWRPEYGTACVGRHYLDCLHQHLCAFTCGSVYGCVVAKYFEIPYSGALLIAEDLPELSDLGFTAGTHFVAVDHRSDLPGVIREVCLNPDQFESMRRAGQCLANARHTESARQHDARRVADEILTRLGQTPQNTAL